MRARTVCTLHLSLLSPLTTHPLVLSFSCSQVRTPNGVACHAWSRHVTSWKFSFRRAACRLHCLIGLSAIGHFSVTLGRTVHASVTFDVTLGNAKTLGKHGVVTLSRPIYPPMCARTRTTAATPLKAGFFSQWRKTPFRRHA